MKKIMIALSCIAAFSCASSKVEETRTPAQTANFGTFKNFKGTPLYNGCHVTLVDLATQQTIHEADISTFESVGSIPVLNHEDKVVGLEKKGRSWGTASACYSSRTANKNIFRESKKTALDYCFIMNDADSEDVNSAYAEIALVRRSAKKDEFVASAPMAYLNRDNTLKIMGQGEGSVVIEDKYQLTAKCALNQN